VIDAPVAIGPTRIATSDCRGDVRREEITKRGCVANTSSIE
jgi:hypothetical protein